VSRVGKVAMEFCFPMRFVMHEMHKRSDRYEGGEKRKGAMQNEEKKKLKNRQNNKSVRSQCRKCGCL